MPVLLVDDGKLQNKNLRVIKDDEETVKRFINDLGGTLKSTEVLTVDGNGRVYFKKKKEKFRVTQYPLKEGVQW